MKDSNTQFYTVKWRNIVIGFNIVTSLSKFWTGQNSCSIEFIRLV